MASIFFIYGAVILMYKFFGTTGIVCWTCMATILANIEVLRVVEAFGIEHLPGDGYYPRKSWGGGSEKGC